MKMDFQVTLSEADFGKLIHKYHFKEEDMEKVRGLYQALWPLFDVHAYYEWKKAGDDPDLSVTYPEYLVVFLTIGKGPDELQDFYESRECISESYIIDCIGLEVMMKAYEKFIKKIQETSGKWAQKIDFFGDTYPITQMRDCMERMEEMDISMNEKFVLSPSKSVAFYLPVNADEKPKKDPCHICENCANTQCMFRTEAKGISKNETKKSGVIPKNIKEADTAKASQVKPYGYTRIFGDK